MDEKTQKVVNMIVIKVRDYMTLDGMSRKDAVAKATAEVPGGKDVSPMLIEAQTGRL
ncbi:MULTISPECIES: hypothetical protein [unclassified Streptomyces]|uniref:hypothetical protein n=1 Tax=unclassified Streptomyces TaxID=2593676 RepID=UPI0034188AAE